jgi:hypothetical protein
MAKDDRLEIQWVTFAADARLSSDRGGVKALVSNEKTKLYLGFIAGIPFVIVEDKALRSPATVPWPNVASLGWVTPPTVSNGEPKTKGLA